ncbi:2-oxoacid:ferredoxin oxidoreductase subunit gamma [Coriobacteriales bacterium OH1046]|nr:2-oxoacid:ferredoxin oxidoreductase subunit gamma [Coriobacteriales bacterium OH1046]
MADHEIVIAGFGGQGLLFAGKVLAYAGLLEGRELSWLPSYGPEMRGGTANCNVILSDTPVGSPIVQHPNVLVVMNAPSLDKYEPLVAPGGKIFVDSTLVTRKVERTDVDVFYVPATQMAADRGMHDLANMVLLGTVLRETGCVGEETIDEALRHVIPARKAHLFDANKAAIEAGKGYVSAA